MKFVFTDDTGCRRYYSVVPPVTTKSTSWQLLDFTDTTLNPLHYKQQYVRLYDLPTS